MTRCSGQRSLQATFVIIGNPSVDFTCPALNYLAKFFSESSETSENLYVDFNKELSEISSFSEVKSYTLNKPLSESFLSLDLTQKLINKPFYDTASGADFKVLSFYKYNTENLSTAMFGELFLHSYVEIDYFTGTYVGTLQQFS